MCSKTAASSYYINERATAPPHSIRKDILNMNNCLCNLFDDNSTWLIIIALVLIFCCACN